MKVNVGSGGDYNLLKLNVTCERKGAMRVVECCGGQDCMICGQV